MSWTTTPPTKPGRYWWRSTEKPPHGEPDYGIVLVAWRPPYAFTGETKPTLNFRTVLRMGGYNGETRDDGGWGTGGLGMHEHAVDAMEKLKIEIWSEPLTGPPGLLPELPGRPPDLASEEIRAHKSEQKARTKAHEKREKKKATVRAKTIAAARAAGDTVYECTDCDEIYVSDDALVTVRECPHCQDERFDGDENGQRCPSCNRTFTRLVTEDGCPNCLEECCALSESA